MMWYRIAQKQDNNANDRQILDMTGGVTSRKTQEPQIVPDAEPELEKLDNQNVDVSPDLYLDNQSSDVIKEDTDDSLPESEDVFTDYTPPSSQDEDIVDQAQDMYRAEDLQVILDNVGVSLPMHDSCRCRIQFRPDDSDNNLLVPRWEVSPGSCVHCINAQQSFNQYVEQTGVRVNRPGYEVA